jgi:SAM-dependent methyltransferase
MIDCCCRFCREPLSETVLDLGASPIANDFVHPARSLDPEPFYALSIMVCDNCFLVQVPDVGTREQIFTDDYIYHSSWSKSILEHSQRYVDAVSARFGIGDNHRVVEVASNDGYLLRYFMERGVPVLGIEPCESVAAVARAAGIPTRPEFFGAATARALREEGVKADLLIGNNVYAHVPDINDFTAGLKIALAPGGIVTLEFPHLLKVIQGPFFDTIYHEHFSYLSLLTVERIFAANGLRIFDVEEIAPQGGSLRIYGCHKEDADQAETERLVELRRREVAERLGTLGAYRSYAGVVAQRKRALLRFLFDVQEDGRTVAGYGAPAKGNTLLNFCGVKKDLLPYTVDVSPHKQNLLLPGSRIPVFAPQKIFETRPDYVLILAWNIKEEVMASMAEIASWGGRFVVPLPEVTVIEPPRRRLLHFPTERAMTAIMPQAIGGSA